MRFVNHGFGGEENSDTKYKFVRGSVHIALYAKNDIKAGKEILFNYGDSYQLDWLLEYNEKIKKARKEEELRKKKLRKKKTLQIDLFQDVNAYVDEEVLFSDIDSH